MCCQFCPKKETYHISLFSMCYKDHAQDCQKSGLNGKTELHKSASQVYTAG